MDSVDDRLTPNREEVTRPNRPERRRNRTFLLLVLLGGAISAFALYNIVGLIRQSRMDSRFAPRRRVSLEEPLETREGLPAGEAVGGPSLRVAIAPVISPEESLQRYRALVHYLAAKLNREPDFLQGKTYEHVNSLVHNGQCDVAMVCTYAFVRGAEEFGMEALAVPVIEGEDHYHSYILVPRSSPATSLLDLRGQRFGSANRLSNSGWLYPMVWLEKNGEDTETFFKGNHVITGSHDRSVRQVVSRHVDGAAVDSLVYEQMVEEDPSIAEKTKVIDTSPEFGMPPVVVPPQIDPELKGKLLEVLLDMHLDAEGRKVLASLRFDKFIRPRAGLFDSVRQNAEYLESRR